MRIYTAVALLMLVVGGSLLMTSPADAGNCQVCPKTGKLLCLK